MSIGRGEDVSETRLALGRNALTTETGRKGVRRLQGKKPETHEDDWAKTETIPEATRLMMIADG